MIRIRTAAERGLVARAVSDETEIGIAATEPAEVLLLLRSKLRVAYFFCTQAPSSPRNQVPDGAFSAISRA